MPKVHKVHEVHKPDSNMHFSPFAFRLSPFISAFGLYFRYLEISVKSQMQYRASFVMLSIGHFLVIGMEFLGVVALFDRFKNLQGWSLPEVAFFYGIVNVSFAIADATSGGFDRFGAFVKSGDFDRLLVRPRNTALQLAGQELTLRRVGRFLPGLAVLLWSASELNLDWSLAKIILTIAAILGGACLFYGLIVLQATLAFWTTESLEIVNTVTYGGVEAAQFPITIYRPWFRRFFIFVIPLACISYFPALAILEKADPLGMPRFLQWWSPMAGLIFLVVTLQLWKIGVRHYRSTGS
jgi:ABC-2 type transport system permease protein